LSGPCVALLADCVRHRSLTAGLEMLFEYLMRQFWIVDGREEVHRLGSELFRLSYHPVSEDQAIGREIIADLVTQYLLPVDLE
jgi:hypothetical protein